MEKVLNLDNPLFGYCRFNAILSEMDFYNPCWFFLLQIIPDEISYAWVFEKKANDLGVFHLVFSIGNRKASVPLIEMAETFAAEWDKVLRGMGLPEDSAKYAGVITPRHFIRVVVGGL